MVNTSEKRILRLYTGFVTKAMCDVCAVPQGVGLFYGRPVDDPDAVCVKCGYQHPCVEERTSNAP